MRPATRQLGVGAAVGLAMALLSFSPGFLIGTGPRWEHAGDDHVAYLVSWHYFAADAWRFPLFDVPAMGYPEGGSVLFNDGLPLAVLPVKIIAHLGGPLWNPFGPWILLTYVLQGAMAVRLFRACGGESSWAAAAVACLAVASTPFSNRIEHVDLSSHFLLLWALAVYVESAADASFRWHEHIALSVVTLLVQSYLFVMVSAIQAAAVLSFAWRRRKPWEFLRPLLWWGLVILLLTWIMGYGAFLTGTARTTALGFGKFSWNLPTLLVPPALFGYPVPLVRDATGGQYEGESYIGLGALLLLLLAVVTAPRACWRAVREQPWLAFVITCFCLFAASNMVYTGARQLVHIQLSDAALRWASSFRASGRFVWPLAYVLIVMPAAVVYRRWSTSTTAVVLAAAVLLQLFEWTPAAGQRRQWSAVGEAEQIDTALLDKWLSQQDRLFMFPSFSCGGVAGPRVLMGGPVTNRELQVQLLAARLNKPNNSVYTSRRVKNCAHELAWATAPTIEPGTLYLINHGQIRQSPALQQAVAAAFCHDLSWALACSTKSIF